MMRLLSIGIDCVSSAIFVILALAILQCTIYRKWEFKPFCVKLIFAFYAIAMFSVVGEYHFIYTDGIFCTCSLEEFPVFQNHVFHGTRGITGD